MSNAIEAHGLGKTFGKAVAVEALDLEIPSGRVFGLLGPNGAGKTTTIRMLATLLRPTHGTATVLGHDIRTEAKQVRRRISLTGQAASVDEELTGHENLVMFGRLLGLGRGEAKDRSTELLEAFQLADSASKQVKAYSGGMRRKIDIAASLVVAPEVLFLDEPTTGLDPRSRNQVWEIVRAVANQGTTVLLTTQYLEEADRLAHRLGVIDNGRLIAQGAPGELKANVGAGSLHVRVQDPSTRTRARELLARELGVPATSGTDPDTISVAADASSARRALEALERANIRVAEFSLGRPSLDEVFLALTGKARAEVQA